MTKILAIDVGGKRWGWCYLDEVGEESGSEKTISYSEFYTRLHELMHDWKPEIIVCGKPNRYYNVVACQSKYIGIVCLFAEDREIPLVEINDSQARATLFPKNGNKKKEDILKLIGINDPDQADAIVLARGWEKMNISK